MASYSPQERAYYDQLFSIIDKNDSGVLPGQDALPFLVSSNLPQTTLGEVWALADPENNGFLTREAWYRAARLIGWMQKNGQSTVDESLVNKGELGWIAVLIYSWTLSYFLWTPASSSASSNVSPDYRSAIWWRWSASIDSCGPCKVHQDLCRMRSVEWLGNW
jgi:hypothetical protein